LPFFSLIVYLSYLKCYFLFFYINTSELIKNWNSS